LSIGEWTDVAFLPFDTPLPPNDISSSNRAQTFWLLLEQLHTFVAELLRQSSLSLRIQNHPESIRPNIFLKKNFEFLKQQFPTMYPIRK
jgi:hypothetical protein